MLKKLTLLTTLMLSATSFEAMSAPEIEGWTFIVSTSDFNFYIKKGSLTEKKNSRIMLFQQVPSEQNTDKNVTFRRFSIPIQACKDEYGEITMFDLGGRIVSRVDYVKGGSSAAAYMADLACMELDQRL